MTRGPDKQFDPDTALEKAMHLFWANGYANTGISDIQAALGLGRKSLYDTFGCKRDLYVKALEKYARSGSMHLEALSGAGPALDQIRALMRDCAEMHASPDSIGCMMGVSIAEFGNDDPEIAGVVRTNLKIIENALFAAFERAKHSREISEKSDSRDLARMFVALIQGVALVGRSQSDPELPHSIVNAAMGLLERG